MLPLFHVTNSGKMSTYMHAQKEPILSKSVASMGKW